jgi:hypothetical protein
MNDFLKDLFNLFCSYEINFGLNEKFHHKSSVPSLEKRESQIEEVEDNGLSEELLYLSLQEYMAEFIKNYPEIAEHIVHAIISTTNTLALFCTEEGSRYCSKHHDEILREAQTKLRVDSVYIVELDSKEALTEEDVQEVMSRIVTKEQNEVRGSVVRRNKRGIKIEKKSKDSESRKEKEGYSLEELHDLASNRGLDKMPLTLELCQDILDYLWEREKEDLLRL